MDKLFEIFESKSALLILADVSKDEVNKASRSIASHAQCDTSYSLEDASNELLARSKSESDSREPIIAVDIIEEESSDVMDFVHMDNIATQGNTYKVGAVIGFVSPKNIADIIKDSSGIEKFALSKATVVKTDYALTYMSE